MSAGVNRRIRSFIFKLPNMWKSEDARSRLYDVCWAPCEHTRVQQESGNVSSTACIVLWHFSHCRTPPEKATGSPSLHSAWCSQKRPCQRPTRLSSAQSQRSQLSQNFFQSYTEFGTLDTNDSWTHNACCNLLYNANVHT